GRMARLRHDRHGAAERDGERNPAFPRSRVELELHRVSIETRAARGGAHAGGFFFASVGLPGRSPWLPRLLHALDRASGTRSFHPLAADRRRGSGSACGCLLPPVEPAETVADAHRQSTPTRMMTSAGSTMKPAMR